MFEGLFTLPYDHGRWLNDQSILIERLREANTEFYNEQAEKLQSFQEGNQASIVMIEIVKERVEKHLTSDTACAINNNDAIVDTCQ